MQIHWSCGPRPKHVCVLPSTRDRGERRAETAYQFPVTLTAKHHTPSGLKQQKTILSQSWRPEVPNPDAGRTGLPPKALGKKTSCLFQLLMVASISGIPCPLAQNSNLCLCLHSVCLCLNFPTFFFFSIRMPVTGLESTLIHLNFFLT